MGKEHRVHSNGQRTSKQKCATIVRVMHMSSIGTAHIGLCGSSPKRIPRSTVETQLSEMATTQHGAVAGAERARGERSLLLSGPEAKKASRHPNMWGGVFRRSYVTEAIRL